ncbi:putative uncharacterized protein [Pseudomonas sp. StFLB209]|nr:putative uncharacterized protein [Pseudomonas sp. StFLB209]
MEPRTGSYTPLHVIAPGVVMLKVAIVVSLAAMLVSLFSGLVFLTRDQQPSTRLLSALTLRVILAVLSVALITWGFYSGQIGTG